MFKLYDDLSDKNKGFVLLTAGIVLLLASIGLLPHWLHTATAILLIVCGLIKTGLHVQIQEWFKKFRKK